MGLNDFKYAWRFTDINYAVFSERELSDIQIISAEKAYKIWDSVCDHSIFQKCSFIQKIVSKSMPTFIGDCGWGDDNKEAHTRKMLEDLFAKEKVDSLMALYDCKTAIEISSNLFTNRWTDFCYPTDSVVLIFGHQCLLYYEDTLYIFALEETLSCCTSSQ